MLHAQLVLAAPCQGPCHYDWLGLIDKANGWSRERWEILPISCCIHKKVEAAQEKERDRLRLHPPNLHTMSLEEKLAKLKEPNLQSQQHVRIFHIVKISDHY
jgi:hypothetical protein